MRTRYLLHAAILLVCAATLMLIGLPGEAGANCGPGPLVVQGKKGIILQSLGATTNATLLPTQALAISTGTSGCSNSGIVERDRDAVRFVAVHGDNVERDFARGSGGYLQSMAVLLGCPATLDADFARFAQTQVAGPVDPRIAPAEWVVSVRSALAEHPALAKGCTAGV